MKIGLIVGSLRKESWNKKIALEVKELLEGKAEAEFIDISNVGFYNQDLDGKDEEYTKLREAIADKDAFMFFTPEYNRSYAPAIKNAIDIGSTNPKGNLWAKKPASVFSASIGGFGGMAGNHALRNTFNYVDIIDMKQPEVYLPKVQDLYEDGKLNDGTKDFLKSAVDAFIAHAEMVNANK